MSERAVYLPDYWERETFRSRYDTRRMRPAWRPAFSAPQKFTPRVIGRRLTHPLLGLALELIDETPDPWVWLEESRPVPVAPRPVEVFQPYRYHSRGQVQTLDFSLVGPDPLALPSPQPIALPTVVTASPIVERGQEERAAFSFLPSPLKGSARVRIRRTTLRGTRQRRRDVKSRDYRAYRAAMQLINRTYGTFSEYLDAYEAFIWNVYVDGKPLAQHDDKLAAFLSGRATLNLGGLAADLLANEIVDRSIGYVAKRTKKEARKAGIRTIGVY